MQLTQTNPVLTGISPAIVASVVLGGLQVFDIWTPTDDQNQWIYTALLPVLMALGAWFGRHYAWAPASVEAALGAQRAGANQEIAAARADARRDSSHPTVGMTSREELDVLLRRLRALSSREPTPPEGQLQPPPVRDPLGMPNPATWAQPSSPPAPPVREPLGLDPNVPPSPADLRLVELQAGDPNDPLDPYRVGGRDPNSEGNL